MLSSTIKKAYFLIINPSRLDIVDMKRCSENLELLLDSHKTALSSFKSNTALQGVSDDEITLFFNPEIFMLFNQGDLVILDSNMQSLNSQVGFKFAPKYIQMDSETGAWNRGMGGDDLSIRILERKILNTDEGMNLILKSVFTTEK